MLPYTTSSFPINPYPRICYPSQTYLIHSNRKVREESFFAFASAWAKLGPSHMRLCDPSQDLLSLAICWGSRNKVQVTSSHSTQKVASHLGPNHLYHPELPKPHVPTRLLQRDLYPGPLRMVKFGTDSRKARCLSQPPHIGSSHPKHKGV